MGSYFTDVYLKRMNIDGTTQQERVKTRKEKEFDLLFLKKTEHQARLYQVNDEECSVLCSLQPNLWNQNHLIARVLTSTAEKPLHTGDLLYIKQTIKEEEQDKIWLILFVDSDMTKGYRAYRVICLDSTVNFTDEYGTTQYSIPVKFTNVSATMILDMFIHSAVQIGYREPHGNRFIITRDFDFIKKTKYFEHKERGWEVAGIDNMSIDNVAYITISEKMVRDNEPLTSKDIPVGHDTNFFLNGA